MANASPTKDRVGPKSRQMDPHRSSIVADLPGTSYTRIPANHNSRSVKHDALRQAASAILNSGGYSDGWRTRQPQYCKESLTTPSRFTREAGYVDSESDFDHAESDSGDSSSHAVEEVLRLKQELVELKERQDQLLKANAGRIREMNELKRACQAVESRSSHLTGQLEKLQITHGKLKEHLQCQICLEPLEKPWSLSPCGHVACLECLLSWFKTPRADEECEYPEAALSRVKTCPQCRAIVLTRPTPSFILKNLVEEMQSTSLLDRNQSNPSDATQDATDPWTNIFPEACNCASEWITELEDPSEITGGDVDSDVLSIDSPSESSAYQADFLARRDHLDHVMDWEVDMRNSNTGGWVAPRWEPPRFDSGLTEVTNEDTVRLNRAQGEIISLLRRGATKEMIALYRLSYDHDHGITVDAQTQLQLGWNISRNADDNGQLFMATVLEELAQHPERFGIAQMYPRTTPTIVRLVPSLGSPEEDNVSEGSWDTEDSLGDL